MGRKASYRRNNVKEAVNDETAVKNVETVKEKVEGENEGTTVTDVIAYDINLMLDGKKLNNEAWNQDDNYVSFVGEGTFDEENGTVTITDEVSEMALTFGVAVNDDDTLTLDMGDLGSATVEEATLAVAVQGLKYAVENGTEMN